MSIIYNQGNEYGGGTTNYNDLSDKPKIGGVDLISNKTISQLGGVQTFNGRSGSVLPMAGDYSAEQVNYTSNQTVKQKIDALATKEASDIAGQQSLVKDTVGWTGKNLLKNKGSNVTHLGVTFTVNSDGSITANGTSEGVSNYVLVTDLSKYQSLGDLYLTGCPEGGSESKYEIIVCNSDGASFYHSATDHTKTRDFGNGTSLNVDTIQSANSTPVNLKQSSIRILIRNNQSVSNLTFYPMLRKADITDPTYEPYHENVETMYEEEIHGVNLLKNEATTQTKYGVTFTVNSDGSVTVNGTCTSNFNYDICTAANNSEGQRLRGKYIASAGVLIPVGGNFSLKKNDNSSYWGLGNWNTEMEVEFTDSIYWSGRVYIYSSSGTVWDNVRIYPMLRKADIDDSTYRPYNPQAIQNQLNAQGVLGAKNLFKLNNVGRTVNGVTFTLNDDNSFTVNGTATADTYFESHIMSAKANDVYIVSDNLANPSDSTYRGKVMGKTTGIDYVFLITGKEKKFTVTNTENIVYSFKVKSGQTVNNITFKPMLRLASDPDDTYQPYAMTNRELTEVKNVNVTAGANVTLNANTNVSKVGKVVSGRLRLEFTGTLTVQQVLATLSDKPVVDTYTIGIESNTNKVMPIIILSNGQVLLFGSNLPTTDNHLIIPINFITV